MELISLLLCLILLCISLIFLYKYEILKGFLTAKYDEEFVVADVVHALKKVCPIDCNHGWNLIPLSHGLPRCWSSALQGFSNKINLYGASCAIACSSVYAFSLIADVSKWGEWESSRSFRCLHVDPICDSKLTKDCVMHGEKIIDSRCGTHVQSVLAMYRFLSFKEKTVKWILFWNATRLEFMFFLIQPAISKTVDGQCLITHIFGTKRNLSLSNAAFIPQRLQNMKEFLIISQMHVAMPKSSVSSPAMPCTNYSNPNAKPSKNKSDTDSIDPIEGSRRNLQLVFVLVPLSKYFFKLVPRKSRGFELEMRSKKGVGKSKVILEKKTQLAPINAEKPLRRTMSDFHIKPKHRPDFSSSHDVRYSQSIPETPEFQNSNATEEAFTESCTKTPVKTPQSLQQNAKVRSMSEPAVKNLGKKKTSSSELSEIISDDDSYVNLLPEESIKDEVIVSEQYYKNELFGSSTSDFEVLESSQQYLDAKIADFLTQGNYAASELQAQAMITSDFDEKLSYGDEVYGGWMYHSHFKGIPVLSKVTVGRFMKITSFLSQIDVPSSRQDIWTCVKNPRFRFFSDETVKTVKILERISQTQKLIHIYHEMNSLFKKEPVDFCLLQTEREETSHCYSSFHSVECEKCPLMTSVVRGTLRPSGWIIEELDLKHCKVTLIMQALVSSSDSLFISELCTLVPLSLYHLKNYLASQPK